MLLRGSYVFRSGWGWVGYASLIKENGFPDVLTRSTYDATQGKLDFLEAGGVGLGTPTCQGQRLPGWWYTLTHDTTKGKLDFRSGWGCVGYASLIKENGFPDVLT